MQVPPKTPIVLRPRPTSTKTRIKTDRVKVIALTYYESETNIH